MRIMKTLGELLVALSALLSTRSAAYAQGTITFDGAPVQPPGTAYLVQSYRESGVWFVPIPGTDGFIRQGSNPPAVFWPDNGTAYVVASVGDSLMFGMDDGTEFGLASVDLAEWSTDYPQPVTVPFVGYRSDGSIITESFTTDGIIDGTGPLKDFQTFYFSAQFVGVRRVQVLTYGWSLDNVVFAIPEPTAISLGLVGFVVWRLFRKRREAGPFQSDTFLRRLPAIRHA